MFSGCVNVREAVDCFAVKKPTQLCGESGRVQMLLTFTVVAIAFVVGQAAAFEFGFVIAQR